MLGRRLIVIPGGSGQVGQMIGRHSHANGHAVVVLSRNPKPAPWRVVAWDGRNPGPWVAELEASDVCINLAGRSVNCRYTPENRRAIYDSRIDSTRVLGEAISSLHRPPHLWLNASTATIYRHALDRPQDEADGELGGDEPDAPDTWKFSIKVAKDWEAALFSAATPETGKVALRSAITLSPDRGGAFEVLSNLVRCGLGGKQGRGDQFVSWIHAEDFVRAIDHVIEQEQFEGKVNICSPNPLPNREFMQVLRTAWGVRVGVPAPSWMIEVGSLVLRTESELVVKSRRVEPGRLLNSGFDFHFSRWQAAAEDLVRKWR